MGSDLLWEELELKGLAQLSLLEREGAEVKGSDEAGLADEVLGVYRGHSSDPAVPLPLHVPDGLHVVAIYVPPEVGPCLVPWRACCR